MCFHYPPYRQASRRLNKSYITRPLLLLTFGVLLVACGSAPQDNETHSHHEHNANHSHAHSGSKSPTYANNKPPIQEPNQSLSQINLSNFYKEGMVNTPEIVTCTLENGVQAECAKLVVKYLPDDLEIGPFCPETMDGEGGIWNWDGDKAGLYRVDAEFLRMLDEQGYRLYDDNGGVHITDQAMSAPKFDHSCINVSVDKEVEMTIFIPTQPVLADSPSPLGVVNKVGISLSGVPIFSDAPSVQHTGHMPALDTCAGHVDPGGWYHYHGTASDMEALYENENINADCHLTQNSSALFGYAFDGIGIYGSTEENGQVPTDLDACNGHIGYVPGKQEKVYHYHASTEFPNLPKCLTGVVAKNNFVTTAKAGVGATKSGRQEPPRPNHGGMLSQNGDNQADQGQGRPPQGEQGNQGIPPGFTEAAETLGIRVELLFQTLNDAGGPRADLSKVAATLGITEEALKDALPEPPRRQ